MGVQKRRTAAQRRRKRELDRIWRAKNKDKVRAWNRAHQYGITPADYAAMLARQDHKCAICGVPASLLKYELYVDHCHTTQRLRGLLCAKCNTALGMMDENLDRLQRAALYIMLG